MSVNIIYEYLRMKMTMFDSWIHRKKIIQIIPKGQTKLLQAILIEDQPRILQTLFYYHLTINQYKKRLKFFFLFQGLTIPLKGPVRYIEANLITDYLKMRLTKIDEIPSIGFSEHGVILLFLVPVLLKGANCASQYTSKLKCYKATADLI